jgi:PPOX class probable F420-dependent enzyme
MVDNSKTGRLAAQKLRDEEVIWLTTVSPKGQPESVPVWFYWDGETVLIYSQPGKPKARNIEANPRVALNFNTDPLVNLVVRLWGRATFYPNAPKATGVPGMIDKYRESFKRLGATPEQFADGYSVAIQIRPTKVSAF